MVYDVVAHPDRRQQWRRRSRHDGSARADSTPARSAPRARARTTCAGTASRAQSRRAVAKYRKGAAIGRAPSAKVKRATKTYTVKAGDFLLGVRQPRKRAVDLVFAACIAGNMFRSRRQIEEALDPSRNPNRPLIQVELPTGVVIESWRDD